MTVEPGSLFSLGLNRHGYAFQHGVIEEFRRLFQGRQSGFIFEAIELSVETRGRPTRIDVVLRRRETQQYLVIECKRADPAFSWCFVKAPIARDEPVSHLLFAEGLMRRGDTEIWSPTLRHEVAVSDRAFHIAFETANGSKGDGKSSGKGAIEDAAGQVLLGVGGFSNFLNERWKLFLRQDRAATIIPVVVTTAPIWTSTVDLSNTDLESGTIAVTNEQVVPMDWVVFQYHMSRALRAEAEVWDEQRPPSRIAQAAELEFVRSVCITRPSGLLNLLGRLDQAW